MVSVGVVISQEQDGSVQAREARTAEPIKTICTKILLLFYENKNRNSDF